MKGRFVYIACFLLLCITIPWNLAFISNLMIDRQVRADFISLQGRLRDVSAAEHSPLYIIFNATGKLSSTRSRRGTGKRSEEESNSDGPSSFQTIPNIKLSSGVTMDFLLRVKLVNLVDMTLLQMTSQRNLKGWRWIKVNDWEMEQKIRAEKF